MHPRSLAILGLLAILAACDDPGGICEDTTSAKISAYLASQTLIERRLKSPGTADFPRYSAISVAQIERCRFMVRAFVDSENAFGGTVRTRYAMTLFADPVDRSHTMQSLDLH